MMRTKLAMILAGGLALALVTTTRLETAHATECGNVTQVTADIFNEADRLASKYGCGSIPDCDRVQKYANIVKDLIGFWNKMAGNSWAKIGPRKLEWGVKHTGDIIGTTGRKFVAVAPASHAKVEVTITETGGKGKTGVAICRTTKNGSVEKVKEFTFNDSSSQKNNKSEKLVFTVAKAEEKIITVHFDGKSVGNSFGYDLKAVQK
jgi:hypothetical protein